MATQDTSMKRWNIFAAELEDMLASRGVSLSLLDNRASIHREKVRRLRQSLLKPKSFPILSTDEMDKVIRVFGLNDTEVLRLRAAMLATSIEKMLMDRIQQDDALLAAEQLFPLLFKAMQEGASDLGSVRGGDIIESEEDEIDIVLESALEAIDSTTIAFQLSRNVASHTERIEKARQARDGFVMALKELEEGIDEDDDVRTTPAWQHWHADAQRGLAATNERLEELGE